MPYEYLHSAHSAGNLTSIHHQQVVKEQFIASGAGGPAVRARPGIPPELRGSQPGAVPQDVRSSPAPPVQYVHDQPPISSDYLVTSKEYSLPHEYQHSPRDYPGREVYPRVGPPGYALPPRDYGVPHHHSPHHYCDCHLTKVHHYHGNYHHHQHDNYAPPPPLSQSQEQFLYEQRRHSYGEVHFRNVAPHVVDIPLDDHTAVSSPQRHYGEHETNLHKSHVQYLAHHGGRPITPHDYQSTVSPHQQLYSLPSDHSATSSPRADTSIVSSHLSSPHSVIQSQADQAPHTPVSSAIDSSGYVSSDSKLTESFKLDPTLDALRREDDDLMAESADTLKADDEEDELSDVPTKDTPPRGTEGSGAAGQEAGAPGDSAAATEATPPQQPIRTGSAVMYIDLNAPGETPV